MEQENITDVATFKLQPDFQVLKKYINLGSNDKEVKSFIKQYSKSGCLIELPFVPISEEQSLADGFVSIINKYGLQGHGVNISYMALIMYKYTYQLLTEAQVPASENPGTISQLQDLINFLFATEPWRLKINLETVPNEDESLKRHKSKGKQFEKKEFEITDHQLTSWLRKTLTEAVEKGHVPLKWGHQLYGSKVSDTVDKKFLKLHRDTHLETAAIGTLRTNAIASFCAPIINYLQIETNIKRGTARHWSYPQLSVLIELLILVGYYKSSKPFFKLGQTSPSTVDKKYLDTTLNNKLKQGIILIANPIKTSNSRRP